MSSTCPDRRVDGHRLHQNQQKIPMATSNLSPEIWAIIFEFCTESGVKDKQLNQPTLVKLLRVNKHFFSLAATLLYRDVVIEDLGGFLAGIETKYRQDKTVLANPVGDALAVESFHSKISALRSMRSLTLLPHSTPNFAKTGSYKTEGDIIARQQSSFNKVKACLDLMSITTCPGLNVQSISIGSHEMPDTPEIGRIHSRFFSEMHSIRRKLLELFRPNTWCEYSPLHGYCFEPTLEDFGSREEGLPEIVNIHTTLEGTFPLVWGTTNRIIIIKSKRHSSDDSSTVNPENTAGTTQTSHTAHPSIVPTHMMNLESVPEETDMLPEPTTLETNLIKSIVYTIIRSTPPWLRRKSEDLQEMIDTLTKIEIYGLENLLQFSELEESGLQLPETVDKVIIDRIGVVKRMQSKIYEESSISEDGFWMKSGKKAPSIVLVPATAYPGCKACKHHKRSHA
ncbi:uncharacterized protein I206_106701 [Kwoniella pini CBS 10737]|uniref:Uncharacterized protein n=1 Tax=Kwoniella pini CBS 10737 TaxID=1296096 RepID=A0A1B9HTG3_9TREE|nr:uncharacterized protein I206_07410 [Kwoniella pini CBS 10737]OCF46557.1 hypothetical protein I206_07410 [Kwoniella pini CBS 10737]